MNYSNDELNKWVKFTKFRYESPSEGVGAIESLKTRSFYLISIINCLSVTFPSIAKVSYKVYYAQFFNQINISLLYMDLTLDIWSNFYRWW